MIVIRHFKNLIPELVFLGYLGMISGVLLVKLVGPLNQLLLQGKNMNMGKKENIEKKELINEILLQTNESLQVISEKLSTDWPTNPCSEPLASTKQKSSRLLSLVDFLTLLTVPKSYFTHFYILLTIGCIYTLAWPRSDPSQATHPLIIYLVTIQSLRRLGESYFVTKFSPKSSINVFHYLVGMVHYTLLSINCYLGSSQSLSNLTIPEKLLTNLTNPGRILASWLEYLATLTNLDRLLVTIFIIASVSQFMSHRHLASLRKYSVPSFAYVSSPHYLAEMVIYGLLMVLAWTSLTSQITLNFVVCWIFVVVNLSISALDTHRYYKATYAEYEVPWAAIPYIL